MSSRNLELDPETTTKLVLGCTDSTPTRRLLITVCIHGDEICGLHAVNELLKEGFFHDGFDTDNTQVVILLGNPKAVQEKKRFLDINLNRIFTRQFIDPQLRKDMLRTEYYETSRLDVITAEMEHCDAYLDLHSTSSLSPPFAIVSSEESEEMAKVLPVEFVLHNVTQVITGTSIDHAIRLDKPGICVECGQHKLRQSIEVAKETIQRFITGPTKETSSCKHVLHVDKSVILRKGFQFLKHPKAFDWVAHNELIATDDVNGEIRCPYPMGAYLIMPVSNPVEGEEAWLWGQNKINSVS